MAAAAQLDGAPADLAIVFASGGHLAACEATLEGVGEALEPGSMIGCGAAGVVGGSREVEDGTAVAVWAASLNGAEAHTFQLSARDAGDELVVEPLEGAADADAVILISDPYSFPTDHVLRELAQDAPGVPVIGGVGSARTLDGTAALFFGDEVLEGGAVGVSLSGVELLPCVSQGAAPLGPELTITAADGHVIYELAGQPALAKLQHVIGALPESEREAVARGVMLGIVIDGGHAEYERGDFLVRGLLSADPEAGSVAVGASVREGQVVRLHVRDAVSADVDLREALERHRHALAGKPPAGALLFTCNGRGRAMFGEPDHDAGLVARSLGAPPAAGFFAAGEIGPVGGESFLHGFTATVGVFPA
ncbi:MAG TPA: FIST N-terminal domain-containing protein [Solirubrobacteraceae bacterium]|nr:FIST N-terminal domain-containing protein [Solirubrobacteraceae bacterium]